MPHIKAIADGGKQPRHPIGDRDCAEVTAAKVVEGQGTFGVLPSAEKMART